MHLSMIVSVVGSLHLFNYLRDMTWINFNFLAVYPSNNCQRPYDMCCMFLSVSWPTQIILKINGYSFEEGEREKKRAKSNPVPHSQMHR